MEKTAIAAVSKPSCGFVLKVEKGTFFFACKYKWVSIQKGEKRKSMLKVKKNKNRQRTVVKKPIRIREFEY